MTKPKIVCVVPTVRPECHAAFVKAWTPLFEKHTVELITVWDGDDPYLEFRSFEKGHVGIVADVVPKPTWSGLKPYGNQDLVCRRTDACRNFGFMAAAQRSPTHVLTLDDDCYPLDYKVAGYPERDDPIQAHLDALDRRVPLGWMNTAHDTDLYLRGVPYGIRDEAPVMLSHGVWVGTPDFDGETQLRLEQHTDCELCNGNGQYSVHSGGPDGDEYVECDRCDGKGRTTTGVPHSLPYYVGQVPRGVLFPLCGMNVMVRAEALPYLYYAPMGADCGVFENRVVARNVERTDGLTIADTNVEKVPALHRFADIFMGVFLKREFDRLGWACVTGYSTINHTRASDAAKNFEAEKLGRKWMEWFNSDDAGRSYLDDAHRFYMRSYADKRTRYAALVTSLLEKGGAQ